MFGEGDLLMGKKGSEISPCRECGTNTPEFAAGACASSEVMPRGCSETGMAGRAVEASLATWPGYGHRVLGNATRLCLVEQWRNGRV